MGNAILLMLLVVNFSCAQITQGQTPSVYQGQYTIRPGEVRWLEFPLFHPDGKLYCRDQEVKVVKKDKTGMAFVMESYFSNMEPFSCKLAVGDKVLGEFKFTVREKFFPAEQLRVDSKKIKLSAKDEKRVYEEQLVLNKIYASSIPDFLFSEAFIQPMNSLVTSVYGTKRVYNKQKKGQHLGIDYRAAIGDKVPAANAGKIVFSGDLFYTGWTVIIDHGADIFTVYGHLSKPLVKDGDFVKRGDLVGLSGNTGRTSGPHLHWGVKIQGQYIDGFNLIDESKIHFRN